MGSDSFKYLAFKDISDSIDLFIKSKSNIDTIQQIIDCLIFCFKNGNKILICGNGGSMTQANHFAEELTGRFRSDRRPLPVIPITESSYLSCVSNDYGFENIFSRGVTAYAKPGDVLIVISTSGNSPNIIKACETAKKLGIKIVSLLGKDGGTLKNDSNMQIIIPGKTSDRIQEMHMIILHLIVEGIERKMFPENYEGDLR